MGASQRIVSAPKPAVERGGILSRLLSPWPPYWPLAMLLVGFPLWWIIGISSFLPLALALPMAMQLLHRRTVHLPRGSPWWLMYLVWVLASVFVLWTNAPYAVPGGGLSRLVVFSYRFAWYATCGVVLVWVCNMDEKSLPTRKVVRLLGWMFVITVLGGLLGVLAPNLQLTSLVEMVLPKGFTKVSFVRSLVHPVTASIQSVLGEEGARPTAPFAYANSWGSNLSMYLPFFLFGWLGKNAGWRRSVAPFILIAAAVPIVASLNRGLWASLVVGAIFLVVQLALSGRLLGALGAILILLIAAMVFVASPLGSLASQRLENPHSNERRGQLLSQTVASAAEGSPVVGFGTTRNVKGSFASIAGGGTPECPACRVPPLGTQGQLWLVIFATGLVGAGLFLTFFASQFFRFWRCRTPLQAIGICLLLFFALQLFVYDMLGMPMYAVMIAIGLMWRERYQDNPGDGGMTVDSLITLVRRHVVVLVSLVLTGALAGGVVAFSRTPTYTATVSILLAQSPVYIDADATQGTDGKLPRDITIDTEAAMVVSEQAIQHMRSTVGLGTDVDPRNQISITAPANTSVLNIEVTNTDKALAAVMADALADGYLEVRGQYLAQRRNQMLLELYSQLNSVDGTGLLIDRGLDDPDAEPSGDAPIPVLEEDRIRHSIETLTMMPTGAGEVLRAATAKRNRREAELPIISGALCGALLAFATMAVRGPGKSTRRRKARPSDSSAAMVSHLDDPLGAH